MAIDVELAGLKAAGTYRFERDLSTISSDVLTGGYSNLRLIVGFSKKGPFNSVQLITSASQFIKLYGNIDRSLEKKGSYFHRSALVALSAGPILCLNLLSLDPEKDQIMHRSISTNINKLNKNICTIPYQTVFNTDKFWSLNSETYLDTVKKIEGDDKNILNFTNVGNKPISVLVKKASANNTKGYDITLNEWYGVENVPEYLNGTSFVSDYMVEVYVVGGDFGPELEKKEKAVMISDDNYLKTYEYFYKDVTNDIALFVSPGGNDENIYDHFGDSESESESESGDYVENVNVHPYKRFASDITYQAYFDKYGFKADKLNKFLDLPAVNVIATYVGSLIPNFTNKLNQNIWIEDIINKDTLITGLFCSEDIDMIESAVADDNGVVNEAIDIIGHNFKVFENIDILSYAVSDYEYSIEKEVEIHGKPTNKYYINKNGEPLNVYADNEIIISTDDLKDVKVGDLLLSYVNNDGEFSRLARVVETKPLYEEKDGNYKQDTRHFRVVCSDAVMNFDGENPYVLKYTSIDNICDRYHWTFLKGFKVSDDSMPDGTNERQNKILDMLSEYNVDSNLYKTLIDRDYVQWRYLVDTFGFGIEDECKKVYSLLCKGRQSGFAIVNAPSMKDFKRSPEPSFVDVYGSVKSEYIANGGHINGTQVGMFSLPKEENGASWAAYFYPYLKLSDLAAVKTVPPAAYVSNLFMAKYTASKPWSIVAGPKRGVISGNQVVGVEGTLIHDDRKYLEPMGINPIIWENGVGVEIFANKTAKQTPQSALSSIHAREACIHIQDTVEEILKKYNWEGNTARNREEIKTLVDTFLANMKQGDGVYDFKTVMDTSNNTNELIDSNKGVIDIYVEVVKGLEILAQRLTVLKTGSIESGNFE